ncbi:MAG: DUF748 domain-containing protein [Methylococcales bacterium]|nr:DUF748 domain-containing protein [Methylococcales bacterium]
MNIRHIISTAKKPVLIAGGLLLIYAAALVYILPAVLKSKIPEIIQQETGRKSSISKIQVQPFPLSISIQGFRIEEHNGQPFTAFDNLYIKTGFFRSIRQLSLALDKVSLRNPFIHIAKQKDGTLNFQDLFKAKTEKKEENGQAFPVNIKKISITEGKMVWEDASFAKSVTEAIDQINIDIEDFTTHADNHARLGLSLTLAAGGHLDWKGTASIKPLSSEGHIKLENIKLKTIQALALPDTALFRLNGTEMLEADYNFRYARNNLQLNVNKGRLGIVDFQLLEKGKNRNLIKMPAFALQGIDFNLDQRTIFVEAVSANDADFQAWLDAQGNINYLTLFPAANAGKSANKTAANAVSVEPKKAPWKIKVNSAAFNNFGLNFADQTLKNPVAINLKPINFKLTNYSNETGAIAPFQLDAGVNKTGSIKAVGDAVIQPFSAKAAINAKNIALQNFQAYVAGFVNLEVIDGKFNTDGNAVVTAPQNDKLTVTFKGNTGITNLLIKDPLLKGKDREKVLLKMPAFTVQDIDFNLGNREIVLDSISANNAEFEAWLNPEGVINYQTLFPEANAAGNNANHTMAPTVEPNVSPWKIKVNNMAITDCGLNFEDRTLKKPVVMNLKPINFKLTNYSNQTGGRLPVQLSVGMNKTGLLTLKGDTVIEPLSAELDLDAKNIELETFQPYFDRFVRLDVIDGALHIDGKLSVAKQKQGKLDVKFKGDTGIASLLTRDQVLNKDLVKWEELALKDFAVDLSANRYTAAALVVDKPYARVTIRKDKTVNFNDIVISDKSKSGARPKTAPDKRTDSSKPYFKLGKIQVKDGSSDFSDLSLILPFAAEIKGLDGGARDISSEQNSTVPFALWGNAYDLAPVDVKGEVSPYQGDYNVEINFNGLPMPLISPYMVQFAAYKVEKGKMTLGLKYNLANKVLTASNSIFIDQFELGEKVENPDAVSLPLKLAVALLKDPSGKIKMDVPITGSLEDPKFSIGAIITDALVNVLGKVVTSPFRALASLVGSEKDMSTISFTAGYSFLGKQQREKLDKLAKALEKRPVLNIDIKGAAYQEQDWPIIREDALYEQLKRRRAAEINKEAETKIREEYVELTDDDYKRLLADMFIEKFPLLAEKSFLGMPKLTNPQAGDFYQVAKQKLFTIIKPEPDRLKQLASARAQVIANYLVQTGGVSRERIFILDTAIDPERNNNDIVSILSLNAG